MPPTSRSAAGACRRCSPRARGRAGAGPPPRRGNAARSAGRRGRRGSGPPAGRERARRRPAAVPAARRSLRLRCGAGQPARSSPFRPGRRPRSWRARRPAPGRSGSPGRRRRPRAGTPPPGRRCPTGTAAAACPPRRSTARAAAPPRSWCRGAGPRAAGRAWLAPSLSVCAGSAALLAEFNAYLDREHADPFADSVGYAQVPLWLSRRTRRAYRPGTRRPPGQAGQRARAGPRPLSGEPDPVPDRGSAAARGPPAVMSGPGAGARARRRAPRRWPAPSRRTRRRRRGCWARWPGPRPAGTRPA